MRRIGAALWDIDGTLLTSGGVTARAFIDAVEDVAGIRPPQRDRDLGGRIDPEIAALLLEDVGLDTALVPKVLDRLAALATERRAALDEQVRPLEGIVETLLMLAKAGVRQTVLSGNIESVGRLKLEAAGLIPHLEIDSAGFGSHGDDRVAVGRYAIGKLREAGWTGPLSECWIIGDTFRDLACARALDVRCVLVATGRHPFDELAALGADAVIASFADIGDLADVWGIDLTPDGAST
jgi:phosphoglycolate phosphatase